MNPGALVRFDLFQSTLVALPDGSTEDVDDDWVGVVTEATGDRARVMTSRGLRIVHVRQLVVLAEGSASTLLSWPKRVGAA